MKARRQQKQRVIRGEKQASNPRSAYHHDCPRCDARQGERCTDSLQRVISPHPERRKLASQQERPKAPAAAHKAPRAVIDGRTWTKQVYREYLATDAWQQRRERILARDHNCCTVLNCTATLALNVHHERYPDVLGEEPDEWLHTVCPDHHALIHKLSKSPRITLHQATQLVISGALRTTAR